MLTDYTAVSSTSRHTTYSKPFYPSVKFSGGELLPTYPLEEGVLFFVDEATNMDYDKGRADGILIIPRRLMENRR